jgi:hypothetical protein
MVISTFSRRRKSLPREDRMTFEECEDIRRSIDRFWASATEHYRLSATTQDCLRTDLNENVASLIREEESWQKYDDAFEDFRKRFGTAVNAERRRRIEASTLNESATNVAEEVRGEDTRPD